MIIYADLMGGMISCQFPYILLILGGYMFTKLDLIHREGNISFSKLSIEMLLPVYLFIQVLRGTTADIISKNYLIILSEIFMMLTGLLFGALYIWIAKMDVRSRFSFLALLCFNDIKKLHFLLTKTFCFHLKTQTPVEKEFCSNLTDYGFVHLFFQGICIFYVAEYFLRKESKKLKLLSELNEINKEDEEKGK